MVKPVQSRWLRVFWPELAIRAEFCLPRYMFFGVQRSLPNDEYRGRSGPYKGYSLRN
jgi:hypothetical protein